MNRRFSDTLAEWAVAALCAWQASDLLFTWRHSPFDAAGWLAMGIWLAPFLAPFFLRPVKAGESSGTSKFCWLALATCLLGILTDAHFFKHCALAFACAALVPSFRYSTLWLALSICWMPALGWLLKSISPNAVMFTRLALALGAASLGFTGIFWNKRKVTG